MYQVKGDKPDVNEKNRQFFKVLDIVMKDIFRTPIEELKEFTLFDDICRFEGLNPETGIRVFSRIRDGKIYAYEVVKAVKTKQPDGTPVNIYPSSSQFGLYGRFFPKNSRKIMAYFNNVDWKMLDAQNPTYWNCYPEGYVK